MHRFAAALVALGAWAGLLIQLGATYNQTGTVLGSLWIVLRFFTIITNLLVAVTMTRAALGRRVSVVGLAGLTLAILFVGIIYVVLLHGLVDLSGLALVADILLHYVVPVLMGIYWLTFAPKIGLSWRDPLLWCAYPVAYLFYVAVRGSLDGVYPYPFVDVGALGYGRMLLNALMLLLAYLAGGVGLVGLGRALALRRGARRPLGQQSPSG